MVIVICLVIIAVIAIPFLKALFAGEQHHEQLVLGLRQNQPYTVPARDTVLRHIHVQGPTGAGKTTQLHNLIYQIADYPARYGLCVIDIKDAMACECAELLPARRVADALLWDVRDANRRPVAFNPLAGATQENRTLLVSQLLSCFERLFDKSSWGSRIEHVLRFVLLALTYVPGATLIDVSDMLTDAAFRTRVLTAVDDPVIQHFFAVEFPTFVGSRNSLTAVQPILTKLSIMTAYPQVRRTLGQSIRGISPRQCMDEGHILLCNFTAGVIGEDAARLLASLVVASFQVAALSRVDTAPEQRRPFVLCCDEFQTYLANSSAFENILTLGRGLGLGLLVANQFIEQLTPALKLTIQKNCMYQLNCTEVMNQAQTRTYHGLQLVSFREADPARATVALTPLPPLPAHNRHPEQLATIRAQTLAAFGQSIGVVDRALVARREVAAAAEPPVSFFPRRGGKRNQPEEHDRGFAFYES